MTPDEIRYAVTETLARYETHFREPEKVLEYFHDELEWWTAGATATSGWTNKQQKLATLQNLPNITDSGMRIWPTSFIIEGDKAAVEGESFMKLKNGREYANLYHWVFEFRDGKIVRAKEYMDTAHALDVFGD